MNVASLLLCATLASPFASPQGKENPADPPLTWDSLGSRMVAEVAAGFSGAVLLVKDGEVVLDEGFGLANREKGIPVTRNTVFAIGSTPIDFTKAGILLLMEDEQVRDDETLEAFFDEVPRDKRAITVRHLMTGGSGLQDFHGMPTDRDPDHAWIDRAEMVRRVLDQELLFEPGTDRKHSHSAWGLLAAILEIRSGLSYQAFCRDMLFEPAGMKDTAFNGDPVPEKTLAIGYGEASDGEINAPPYWGEVSWLVMGSGGMVSTTGDLYRWNRALREGKLLSEHSLARYWSGGGLLDGGDMYGFEVLYNEGPQNLVYLFSNSMTRKKRARFDRLGRDLLALVRS